MGARFEDYGIIGINPNYSGDQKTYCPKCSHTRQKKHDKSLSVNALTGVWKCHHCEWAGGLRKSPDYEYTQPIYRPIQNPPKKEAGSEIERYFLNRKIAPETLKKWKVTESDRGEIAFNYRTTADGDVVNVKYRTEDKQFRQETGGMPCFYGLDMLDRTLNYCIICEGEVDALSFAQAQIPNALSVPGGGLKEGERVEKKMQFFDNSAEFISQIDYFYLALDKDEKGQGMQKELIRRIGAERCYIVEFPEDCKDPNDVLVKYGAEMLGIAFAFKRPVPISGAFYVTDSVDDVLAWHETGVPPGFFTHEWPVFDTHVQLVPGCVYTVTGIPGHGKSTFIDNWLLYIFRNNPGFKAAFFSPENDSQAVWIIRLLEVWLAKSFDKFSQFRMTQDEIKKGAEELKSSIFGIFPEDNFRIETIFEIAKKLLFRHGINALVLDPWNNLEHGIRDYNIDLPKVLMKIRQFARKTGIAIILVAHPVKMPKLPDGVNYEVPTPYSISGSAHFFNYTDFCIAVYKYTSIFTSPGQTESEVFVGKVKHKFYGKLGKVDFDFSPDTQRFIECDMLSPKQRLKAQEQV